jgi:VanZ family protein
VRSRILLLGFCLFVVYGSLFPFDFTVDPVEIRRDLAHAVTLPFDATGRRRFSIPDVVANVMLGVPVGFLLVTGGLVGRSIVARVAGAVLLTGAFAAAVEVGQLLAPSRTASALDVAAQAAGALAGAVAAHVMRPLARSAAEGHVVAYLRRRPAWIAAGLLALVLAADALYPFALTLDVSTVRAGIKHALRAPFASVVQRFWADVLVEKVIAYATLALFVRAAQATTPAAGLVAWIAATGVAGGLEVAKLLVAGRAPSPGGFLLAAAGALAGVAVAGWGARRWRGGLPDARVFAVAAAVLLAFQELTPFDFVSSGAAVAAKAARIEWWPFAAYYGADLHKALFDVAKKLVMGAFLGASLAQARVAAPVGWTLAWAAALEAAQVFQVSHLPAVTDVAAITGGAAVGRALLARYQRWAGADEGGGAAPRVSVSRH